MNQRSLNTLEFPKILQQLAEHASFSASKELALHLQPSPIVGEVREELQLTQEARRLLNMKPGVTIGGARDVRPAAHRAALGGVLDPDELLEIRDTLASARSLRNTLTRTDEELPLLVQLANRLYDLRGIEEAVERTVAPDGTILDDASPTLRRLRVEIRSAQSRLMERLQDMISSASLRPYLQEALITVRQGRYVIPVKAEARQHIKGIIHDQSASGATVYIEPLSTVDMNNRWHELQMDEEREIQRILSELSEMVGAKEDEITANVEGIAEIDLVLAKAKYANSINAVEPRIQQERINLINARHPLLRGTVVPVNIYLGDPYGFRMVLITGPNTGGKTVALKTAGLLSVMAQAGLHIPADEGSIVHVFEGIYADIGDEQSIEQSLSTFSSHMTNIIAIINSVDRDSNALVLLDELGAGTDPTEGAALARAILTHLLETGAFVIGTTHYAELKAFAHTTPGIQNASVEFDVETLTPTYRLQIGTPGRSNALAIANRLGLQTEIIESARAMVAPVNMEVEAMLERIQQEREQAEEATRQAEAARDDARKLQQRLNEQYRNIGAERQQILAEARQQMQSELAEMQERLRRAASQLSTADFNRQWAQQEAAAFQQDSRRLMEQEQAERRAAAPATEAPVETGIRVGGQVLVRSLGSTGQVLSINPARETAEVQIGTLRMQARLSDLEPLSRKQAQQAQAQTRARESATHFNPSAAPEERARTVTGARPVARDVNSQIDLRGQRAEDALAMVDRYLNEATLAGLGMVRILHGKGTGALRQAIHNQLRSHRLVKSFHTAPANEGGDGVTVVTLAA